MKVELNNNYYGIFPTFLIHDHLCFLIELSRCFSVQQEIWTLHIYPKKTPASSYFASNRVHSYKDIREDVTTEERNKERCIWSCNLVVLIAEQQWKKVKYNDMNLSAVIVTL